MSPAKSTAKSSAKSSAKSVGRGRRKATSQGGLELTAGARWRRAFLMIVFAAVVFWLLWLLFVLAVAQAVLSKYGDQVNPHLLRVTRNLNAYFTEILAFLAFDSNHVPFPFSPFPDTGD